MSADINFLLHKDEESLRRKRKIKIFNLIAALFLIGVGSISLVIFLLIQAINVPSIKREQDDILRKISQFKGRQAKLLVAADRVNNIQELLDKRKKLPKAMNAILAKTSASNLQITDFELDSKAITLTSQSSSLFYIGTLINNLTDMVRKKEIINSLTLQSLVYDESKNSYSISLRSEL